MNGPGDISRILSDEINWFAEWSAAVLFARPAPDRPKAFADWVEASRNPHIARQPIIDSLVMLHDRFHDLACQVCRDVSGPTGLDEADYREVLAAFRAVTSELKRIERAFTLAESTIDPLTGLRSRLGLMDELEREARRAERFGQPWCVAIADLDHFKSVNDSHGHHAGDIVLVGTAGVISGNIRASDDAWRLGGEEFLIVLKDTTLEDAAMVIERMRLNLAETRIEIDTGHELRVTGSFGLAQFTPGTSVDDLLKQADDATYEAKRQGRNRLILAPLPEAELSIAAE
ncbi:MAG: hypothetical protein Alpg2KO_17960 [Alphaproteobacteria bacterium]